MRELVIDEGTLEGTSTHVRDAVEELGGVVSEHALVRTRFDTLRPGGEAFARAGYVGVYQPFGEARVTLRVRVWARWPRRLVHIILALGAFAALAMFLLRPDPSVWILGSIAAWSALGLAFLVYAGTFDVTRRIETQLVEQLADRVHAETGARVYTKAEWDERAQRLKEAAKMKAKQVKGEAKPEDVRAEEPEPPGDEPETGDDAADEPQRAKRRRSIRIPLLARGRSEEE